MNVLISACVELPSGQDETLQAVLPAALEERNWSYRDLADAAGVSSSAIGGHLAGEYVPRPATLAKYAQALGLPLAHLLVLAGHTPRKRGDRPLRLVAIQEKLDEVWDDLSPELQRTVANFVLGLDASERRKE